MRDSKRLDDMVERIQRLERRFEQLDSNLSVMLHGIAKWMEDTNKVTAINEERITTKLADLDELAQHVRGKLDL